MFQQWHTASQLRRSESWQDRVGKVVEIRENRRLVRRGVVEEEMPDGSGLWLAADVTDRREYFHKDPGLELWA